MRSRSDWRRCPRIRRYTTRFGSFSASVSFRRFVLTFHTCVSLFRRTPLCGGTCTQTLERAMFCSDTQSSFVLANTHTYLLPSLPNLSRRPFGSSPMSKRVFSARYGGTGVRGYGGTGVRSSALLLFPRVSLCSYVSSVATVCGH